MLCQPTAQTTQPGWIHMFAQVLKARAGKITLWRENNIVISCSYSILMQMLHVASCHDQLISVIQFNYPTLLLRQEGSQPCLWYTQSLPKILMIPTRQAQSRQWKTWWRSRLKGRIVTNYYNHCYNNLIKLHKRPLPVWRYSKHWFVLWPRNKLVTRVS